MISTRTYRSQSLPLSARAPGPFPIREQAAFYAPEDVRLEHVPGPECGPDEVKLKVKNCPTCGTDVKIFFNGHQNLTQPRTTGHEVAGEVVEVGADVNEAYGSTGRSMTAPGHRRRAVR